MQSKQRASLGGKAIVARYGRAGMSNLGKIGGLVTSLRYGQEHMSAIRTKAHRDNPKPPEYYRAIAKLPRPSRRKSSS